MQFYRNRRWKYHEGDPTSHVIHCFAEQAFQTQRVILCSFPKSQG